MADRRKSGRRRPTTTSADQWTEIGGPGTYRVPRFLPVLSILFLIPPLVPLSAQSPQDTAEVQPVPVATHIATLVTTFGEIEIELYGEDAPKTVKNFVGLCDSGFYDGLLFHRVHPGFLIQSGCPKTRDTALRSEWGTGGTSIWGAPFASEIDPRTPSALLGYRRGAVAMANNGPNTNTSQFFILLSDVDEWMPPTYTIFGYVPDMTVVDAIGETDLVDVGTMGGRPALPILIETATASAVTAAITDSSE